MQIFIQTILNVQFGCTNHIHDILQTSISHLENFSFSKTLSHYTVTSKSPPFSTLSTSLPFFWHCACGSSQKWNQIIVILSLPYFACL